MKKRICLLLSAVMILAVFAACGKNAINDGKDNGNGNANVNENVDNNANNNANNNDKATNSGKLNDVYMAVKNAYGENYLPDTTINENTLTETYGINMDDVVEYKAETPTMVGTVDTFIGIEAKEGSADKVESALKSYRDKLVSDTGQLPENKYKIEASRVVRSGNYIFFIMLGAPNEKLMETGDEAALKEYSEQEIQKAVDAINTTLSK